MTAMTSFTDKHGRAYRTYRQRTQITCGPACCLIMWANVHGADPIADEGGVIGLSKAYPKPWNPSTGAEIGNLSSVLRSMAVPNELETFSSTGDLRAALHRRVARGKPALAFAEWEVDAAVIGHFVVVGYADARADEWTILDPLHGAQEVTGIPAYYPITDDADPPVLRFTGMVAFAL
jgi:hypothetical protein